ncbi:MAG: 2-C-methyl-D-erythritol 4-phosphate cytidylyltransferase [Betaproteobacteria bacterium]|nr:2-C-methyl-D-erythritol 4-phosphate cytidylyltransferase [Betaproteobacteria bacterium]
MKHFTVIIPAGGSGQRFGSPQPKQFVTISGIPLLHHTLRIFESCPRISRILVALSTPVDVLPISWPFDPPRIRAVCCAGATRAITVANALEHLAAELSSEDWVLVHDAARPCLTTEALERLLDQLSTDTVGGLLAIPVSDTLKRQSSEQRVAQTIDRQQLWAAQTPQMFRFAPLRRALQRHPDATDESSAMEAEGLAPRLVLGEITNLKITYPADLQLAQILLEARHAHRSGI